MMVTRIFTVTTMITAPFRNKYARAGHQSAAHLIARKSMTPMTGSPVAWQPCHGSVFPMKFAIRIAFSKSFMLTCSTSNRLITSIEPSVAVTRIRHPANLCNRGIGLAATSSGPRISSKTSGWQVCNCTCVDSKSRQTPIISRSGCCAIAAWRPLSKSGYREMMSMRFWATGRCLATVCRSFSGPRQDWSGCWTDRGSRYPLFSCPMIWEMRGCCLSLCE